MTKFESSNERFLKRLKAAGIKLVPSERMGYEDLVRGAFDLQDQWWYEDEIKSYTRKFVETSFGKKRQEVEIIEIKRGDILKK